MTLEVKGATVRLGTRAVLRDFSTRIRPGEFVVVIGPNGAGKSTALRLLAGLIAPGEGRVTVDGADIGGLAPKALAKRIAYLPQDRVVHWAMAAERVVALGRLPHRSFAAGEDVNDAKAIEAAMTRMDVWDLRDRPVTELSGGERARVLVARALAQEAGFLIADEPSAGLDPAHGLALFLELSRLAREGHGVVAALHDLSLAFRFASRVILLTDGHCLIDGPPAQVLTKENLATAFEIDAIITEIAGIPVVLPQAARTPTGT
jgi:iron complex transport system ATP-binding protein